MQVSSCMNKYNPRNPKRRAVEKRVAEIEAHYTKRAKKFDVTFAAGINSNPFLSAYMSYGMNGIDSVLAGHFGEVYKRIQAINLLLSEGGCRITRSNITPLLRTLRITKGKKLTLHSRKGSELR